MRASGLLGGVDVAEQVHLPRLALADDPRQGPGAPEIPGEPNVHEARGPLRPRDGEPDVARQGLATNWN